MPEDTYTTTPPEPEWAAFLAVDWADRKHHWKLVSASSLHSKQHGELEHTPEAIESWAAQLHAQFGGRPIAVCLEQPRGSLVYMLHKYPHLVLHAVCPTTSARFRQALYPSGSKSDPGDTGLLLELPLHHRSHLRRFDPDTPETRLLQMLVEQRRKYVNDRTRYSNQLTACLKLHFPQLLKWISFADGLRSAGALTQPAATQACASGRPAQVLRRTQLPVRGTDSGAYRRDLPSPTHGGRPSSAAGRGNHRAGTGGHTEDPEQGYFRTG